MATHWQGHEIAVACSGNFTAERVLGSLGFENFHSNDISLYTCAVGWYLTGKPMRLDVVNPEIDWMKPYMEKGPLDTIAVLMLLLNNLGYSRRLTIFHDRMWDAFIRHYDDLHEKTVAKVEKALEGLKIKEFFAGDCVEFVEKMDPDVAVLGFPPTYEKGYERLYKKLDESFDWDRPDYITFNEDRFNYFVEVLLARKDFYVLRDHPIEQLEDYKVAVVQTGQRSRPVHVYAKFRDAIVVMPHTVTEPIKAPPVTHLTEKIHLKHLSIGQFNSLRSKYLKKVDAPADPSWRLVIVNDDDEFIGALGFTKGYFLGGWSDIYMLSDFAPFTRYRRLSKLVVAVALTVDVKEYLEQQSSMRVKTIGTTAFTDAPVSMKYRGLLDLYSRKEGKLNYVGNAGKWTLDEAYAWWRKKNEKVVDDAI